MISIDDDEWGDRVTAATVVDDPPAARPTRPVWAGIRLLVGVGILGLLLWRVGTGPFVTGIQAVHATALLAALALGALITLSCAWRWTLIAAGLGVQMPIRPAVAAYYRSQFLNTTTPGGIVGDVHRAVRHGADIGDVALGVRAVILDRAAGQVAHIAIAMVLLLAFASPVRPYLPAVLIALATVAAAVAVLSRRTTRLGAGWVADRLRAIGSDVHNGLVARGNWVGIGALSGVAVFGHVATMTIAARAAGVSASMAVLLPVMLLVLLGTAVPLNIAGWGPREGIAAWAFAAAGLSASQGVATAVTFGVLVLAASLPGLGVLIYTGVHRPARRNDREVIHVGDR
jgi:uncharacterized membrane protein YbhN (UPF0104 family)